MKQEKILTFLFVIGALISCDSLSDDTKKSVDLSSSKSDVAQIKAVFESQQFQSIDDAGRYANELIKNQITITRALYEDDYIETINPEAAKVIEQMRCVEVDSAETPETFGLKLKQVIDHSDLEKESSNYRILNYAVDITVDAIHYAISIDASQQATRGFWNSAWKVVKCASGAVGSAGLGALTGSAIGTVTLPIVGTVSGTAVGGWCGAMVGIASFC